MTVRGVSFYHGLGMRDVKDDTVALCCPYCAGRAGHFFAARDINRNTSDETFDYLRCADCGLTFLRNIPEDMARHYAGGYQPIPGSLDRFTRVAARDAYRLEAITDLKRGGRLLEIGPWMGAFAFNAKRAGFSVTTIEMNADCVEFMRNRLGIDAIHSSDPAAAMSRLKEPFDVIVMWHCLEHLHSPWEVIKEAARLLNVDGLLVIGIPNIESYEFTKLGSSWTHIDAPRHFTFFSQQGLRDVCGRFGLSCVRETTDDRLSRILRRSSWQAWASRLIPIPLVKRIFGATFGRLVSWMLIGKKPGAGLTAVFSRPADRGRSPSSV